MINKLDLQSFIDKYYLGGINPQAKWRFKDNSLTVYAGSSSDCCKVVMDNIAFEECELGIFDTHQLNKLISITMGDLHLIPEKKKGIYTKLNISDETYDVSYSLADPIVMNKVSYIKDPNDYDIIVEIDSVIINNLIKAKNALVDEELVKVRTRKGLISEYECILVFGDDESYSNIIEYKLEGEIKEDNINLPFNSNKLKEILSANKDMTHGVLKINKLGLMKLEFEKEGLNSEYFILRNE